MLSHRAIVVHGIGHVRAALAPHQPVILLSAIGAALYAGVGWWMALVALGRAEFPDAVISDLLDCADAPGRAMEALRSGQQHIRLDPGPAWARVAAAAQTMGAKVHADRPSALDLGAPNALWHLNAWLSDERDKAAKPR